MSESWPERNQQLGFRVAKAGRVSCSTCSIWAHAEQAEEAAAGVGRPTAIGGAGLAAPWPGTGTGRGRGRRRRCPGASSPSQRFARGSGGGGAGPAHLDAGRERGREAEGERGREGRGRDGGGGVSREEKRRARKGGPLRERRSLGKWSRSCIYIWLALILKRSRSRQRNMRRSHKKLRRRRRIRSSKIWRNQSQASDGEIERTRKFRWRGWWFRSRSTSGLYGLIYTATSLLPRQCLCLCHLFLMFRYCRFVYFLLPHIHVP